MLINNKVGNKSFFPVSYLQHTYKHAYHLCHSSPFPMTVRGWTSILQGIFLASRMSWRDSHPPSCSATSEYLLYSACPPPHQQWTWRPMRGGGIIRCYPSYTPPMPLQSLFPLHTSTPQSVHINQCRLRLHDIVVGKAPCKFQSLFPLLPPGLNFIDIHV